MKISHKAALSLLITLVLFTAFLVLALGGLFDLVETRFYNPAVTRALRREVNQDEALLNRFFWNLEGQFMGLLNDEGIKRSFLPTQNGEDLFTRSHLFGLLQDEVRGLRWVRFVDAGGIRLHFSTVPQDLAQRSGLFQTYLNYGETSAAVPYEAVEVRENGIPKMTLDAEGYQIIFSFPFSDAFDVYRGTALFAISVQALTEELRTGGRIGIAEQITLVDQPPGIVTRLPSAGRESLIPRIASAWVEEAVGLDVFEPTENLPALVLVSAKTSQGIFVGRLVNEAQFFLSGELRIILLVSFFLTAYLLVFLLLNLRQDPVAVVQDRIKRLQVSLIGQYYERQGEADWSRWSWELAQRRDEIRAEIKRGLRFRLGKTEAADLDLLIDKSWNELSAQIGGGRDTPLAEDHREKLQDLLGLIMRAAPGLRIPPAGGGDTLEVTTVEDEPELLEELSTVEEPADGETLEPLIEELPPVEEPAPVEDLPLAEEVLEAEEAEDPPGQETADPASRIEFSESPESEEPPEALPLKGGSLEIVSPFATILAKFSDDDALNTPDAEPPWEGASSQGGPAPQGGLLKRIENASRHGAKTGIIEERDGVPYINRDLLASGAEDPQNLNQDFIDLVDSVVQTPKP